MAAEFGVSGQTVRESIRAPTAMGLVTSKQESGTFVTAQGDSLTAMSLASVIQLEKLGPTDVLGVLGALLSHAASLAVTRASDADLAEFREAAEQVPAAELRETAVNLKHFLQTLATISHNPLLAVLCRFLIDIQVGLALEMGTERPSAWMKATAPLQDDRMAAVAALEARDVTRAVLCTQACHDHMVDLIGKAARSRSVQPADTGFARLLSQLSAAQKQLLS
ncbi:FCD domain-containing protein [Streptomyces sp. NPDC047061]|uniref:FadR/GntR family transcriptional regulator n=1 Tax=Streptomyces sp. NPDC047061 TaxID=3154605 RepID=UPI0033FDBEF0